MMGHSVIDIWFQMGFLAKAVAIFLIGMSIYSLGLFIERFLLFRAAKKQSIEYLPVATKALREGNYKLAVETAKRFNKSHLAKVLAAGLQQFMFEKAEEPSHDAVESVRLAVERAAALTTAEMKRGLGGLATIGATAPFVGLFGTVVLIIFMVVTPMLQEGVTINLPYAKHSVKTEDDESHAVVVAIKTEKNGEQTVFVQKKPVPREQYLTEMTEIHDRMSDKNVLIKA